MGLVGQTLLLPLAPLRGVFWVAEQIRDEAQRQWADPSVIQAELAAIDAMRDAGTIDEAEAAAREEELIQRLLTASPQENASLDMWEEGPDG